MLDEGVSPELSEDTSIVDRLSSLAECVTLDDRSFHPYGNSWAYSEPPRIPKGHAKEFYNMLDDNNGTFIVGLDIAERMLFLQLLSKISGRKLRFGTLKENIRAVNSECGHYRERVLYYHIATREILHVRGDANSSNNNHIAVKILEGVKPEFRNALEEERYITLDVPQQEVPTQFGYFDNFAGSVPTNSELRSYVKSDKTPESLKECVWQVRKTEAGFYGMECHYNRRTRHLYVIEKLISPTPRVKRTSYGSSDISSIGIWTDEPPRR
jgi:hypothetical protein